MNYEHWSTLPSDNSILSCPSNDSVLTIAFLTLFLILLHRLRLY